MLKRISKIITVLTAVILFSSAFPLYAEAAARDCDSNAVIYCGTYTTAELNNKLNNGTGKQYQSSKELKALFAKYGIEQSQFTNLKNGTVTNDNKVIVNGKIVKSNVYTMGRHFINGSTKISGLSYPLYMRHPSVSFLSSSIDSFVYINDDGSFGYAIIKSCGNIVPGTIKKPTPAPVTVSISVKKFYDTNENKKQDSGEANLSGWSFRVTGTGFSQTIKTLSNGTNVIKGLKPGTYTVTEVLQSGWKNTTGLSITRNVTSDTKTQAFIFGNIKPNTPPPVTPPGGGDIVTPTPIPVVTLPVTGTKEWILAGLLLIILASLLWWVRSKDMLLSAKKGKKTTTAVKKPKKKIKRK